MSKLLIDRTGQRFGKLTVVRIAPTKKRHTMWRCQCDCGKETVTSADNLRSGHTMSCGCNWHELKYPREDLVGRRYGMLVVQSFAGRKKGYGYALWYCQCDCGGRSIAHGDSLKAGTSKSCGCGIRRGLAKANTKHGRAKSPLYRVWAGMCTRCYNKKEKAYRFYGARGVTVCSRWRGRGGFEKFLADMGERPSDQHQIERKRNSRGYEPSNCIWATRAAQTVNKRNTIRVKLNGKTTALKTACRELGLNYYSVRGRMQLKGMSFRQAITAPWRTVVDGQHVWVDKI